MIDIELQQKAKELLEMAETRRTLERDIAEARARLLIAMKTAQVKVVACDEGCVMLRPAYAQQRIDTESLRRHKPDWYKAFCKTVTAGEGLQIIPIDNG